MPYKIRKIGPSAKPYCVVNTETGKTKGCTPTREKAERFMTALRMRAAGKSVDIDNDIELSEEELYELGEKARHSPKHCMSCKAKPTVSVLWANGKGLAWFCDECFEGWKSAHDDDINKIHKLKPDEDPHEWREHKGRIEFKQATRPLAEALGLGQGVSGPVQRVGGTEWCECPECDYKVEHERDTPCADLTCPECDVLLEGAVDKREEPESKFRSTARSKGLRTKALGRLRTLWDAVEETISSLFGGESFELGQDELIFRTKQQDDGRWRWVTISSTAFLDRDNPPEIVSREGIGKSIARADTQSFYGPLLFWHELRVKLGECDFQAQHDLCLIESGLWDDTPAGEAARASIQMKGGEWAVSICFLPLKSQEGALIGGTVVDKVWTDLQIAERSVLPKSISASLFSSIKTGGPGMDEKKKKALFTLLGEELAEEVLKDADEINSKTSDPGAIFKEAEEKAGEPFADQLDGLVASIKEENPAAANRIHAIAKALRASNGEQEHSEQEKEEGGEEKAQKKRPIDELKDIAGLLEDSPKTRLEALVKELDEEEEDEKKDTSDPVLTLLKEIGEKVEGLEAGMKELKGEGTPRGVLHRASESGDNVDKDTTPAGDANAIPRVVQAMSNKMLGIE